MTFISGFCKRITVALILVNFLCLTHLHAQTFPYPITKKKLKNGITVIIVEKKELPIASYQTWFRIGAVDELQPSQFGLAHLFEHLFFSGTEKYPSRLYDELIEGSGGDNNAFTSFDYTQYHVNIRSDQLPLVITLESDRIKNLILTEENLSGEKKIVLEEQRQTYQDALESQAIARVHASLFAQTGYAHPIIGTQESIANYSLEEVKQWHRNHTVAANMLITIVGAVNTDRLLKQLEAAYKDIPTQPLPKARPKLNLPTPTKKHETMSWKVPSSRLYISYRTVAGKHPDTPALDLLAHILHETRASRFYDTFFEKTPMAADLSGEHQSFNQTGVFSTQIVLKPGAPTTLAMDLYQKVISEMTQSGPRREELERAVNDLLLTFDSSTQKVDTIAHILSLNELLADGFSSWWKDIQSAKKVTVKDIIRVTQKYLDPKYMHVLEVIPEKKP